MTDTALPAEQHPESAPATQPAGFFVPERVLVIVPHADDIEFGISGTIARWTDAGSQVTYCIVTDNSAGSNEPDADLTALSATRRDEQLASAAICGVTDLRFLNYRDGTVQPTLDLRKDLTRVIRQVRPQVVILMDPTMMITPDGGYINHPDHRAVSEAALYAVFPSAGTRPIFPELLAEGLEPHNVPKVYLMFTDRPNLYVDVSAVYERKLDALRCHRSQIKEDDLGFIRKWDSESGKLFGVPYAESFRVLNLG